MPCFHPITAYNKIGGGITWTYSESNATKIQISCKQCTGCRQENQRQWAIRCIHEASLHLNNIFVTLTYNNENLPKHNTLVKEHFQLFMKRLRKHKKATKHNKIRYFHCGEYGEKNSLRPHYHAIIYNCKFRS